MNVRSNVRINRCLQHLEPVAVASRARFGAIKYEVLLEFIERLLEQKGSNKEEAHTVAWHLCQSNLKVH